MASLPPSSSASATIQRYSLKGFSSRSALNESFQQLYVAEKADPLSAEIHRRLARALSLTRRYEKALEYCQKLRSSDINRPPLLARVLVGQGRFGEAIELLAETPDSSVGTGLLGYAHARAGRREEAEKLAAASQNPQEQVLIFAGLGDKDRVFEALDRLATRGPARVGWALVGPHLALIRGDPRVQALRKRVGLPQ